MSLGGYFFIDKKNKSLKKITAPVLFATLLIFTGSFLGKPDTFVHSFQWNTIAQSSFLEQLQVSTIPLNTLKKEFAEVHAPLVFSSSTTNFSAQTNKNLVLIILESMPNSALSLFNAADQTQPMLSKYVNRLQRYPNFFCTWPSSNHARMTIWSGLYPIQPFLSVKNPAIHQTSLTQILAQKNYFNALFYSSDKNYTRWNDYLSNRNIDLLEDAQSMGKNKKKEELVSWGVREEITLEKMKQFLSKQKNKKRPFSMTYVPACPHMPFDIQEKRFEQFREGFGSLDGNYNGVYKNELLYMDWILTSLIDHIKACGLLENTIIVMVSDHAEGVVSKKEGLGHGWSTAPNMANISLTIFPAEKSEQGTINPTIGSQVDLLPTILDYLEIPPPNHTLLQGVSIRKNDPLKTGVFI